MENINAMRAKKSSNVPVVFFVKEIEKLRETINPKFRLCFDLTYGCGLRIEELCTLRVKDLDRTQATLTIHRSKTWSTH